MSIKESIIQYLEDKNDWCYGGRIEDYIRSLHGAKASNASRRCRELENAGILEVKKVQVNGKGNFVVQYRIKKYESVMKVGQLSLI